MGRVRQRRARGRRGSRWRFRRRSGRRRRRPWSSRYAPWRASNSSRAERRSSSVEYQPPTNDQAELGELGFQRGAVVGQLVALLHALEAGLLGFGEAGLQRRVAADFLADRRWTSRSGWRRGESSLPQSPNALGLPAPLRMFRARRRPRRARRRGHRDVPPGAARVGRGDRVGVDDDHLQSSGRRAPAANALPVRRSR